MLGGHQVVGIVRDDGTIETIPDPPGGFCQVCGDPGGFALPDIDAINKAELLPRGSPVPRQEPLCPRCIWWRGQNKLLAALKMLERDLAPKLRRELRAARGEREAPRPTATGGVTRLVKFPAWLKDWWRRQA